MVSPYAAIPGWRTTSRGTVDSGSAETMVTVRRDPRRAVVVEVVILNAWATTPYHFVSARLPVPAVTHRA
jgi:hypothetical protein